MAITRAAGFPVSSKGTGGTHPVRSITPAHTSDLVVAIIDFNSPIGGSHVTGVAGGSTSWNAAAAVVNNDSTIGADIELWWGTATGTGAANVTFTVSSALGDDSEITVVSFTGQGTGSWKLGTTGTAVQNTVSTALARPSLTTGSVTPTSAIAGATTVLSDNSIPNPPGTNGTPANWTYLLTADGDAEADGINLAGSTLARPTWSAITSDTSCAVIAEFYIQAAGGVNSGFFELMGL